MPSLFTLILLLESLVYAQTPTATAPLIINQGPVSRCYSWYAELSDAGGYPSEAEWDCPYPDHVGRFTLGTNGWYNWNCTYYEQTPGFNGSVNGVQGSPLTVGLHNDARGVSCSNHELAFTYDFPGSALYSNVSTLDLTQWDSVIIEFDVNVISATSDKSDCSCSDSSACPNWWKTQFTTDILYWWGEEQHDSGDYNVISVRHLDPQNYGFWTWTNSQPGQDHYGHRIQYTDHQAAPGHKSHVELDIKYLIHKYSSQLCQGGGIQGPIHLNSVQFVLINTGSETKLEFSNVKANAFNYSPGQFTSTPVATGCTPTNCPTQPANTAYACGTDPAQPPPGSVTSPVIMPCATPQTIYGQCGGSGWAGPTCCPGGASCQSQNEYYAQCLTTTTSGYGGSPPTTTTTTTPPSGSGPCPAQQTMYGQCGGSGWNGPSCCPAGTTCQVQNEYYSQCLP